MKFKKWSKANTKQKFPLFVEQIKLATTHLLLEAVSKEQKEKGQREMNRFDCQPFHQLEKYLQKKWENKKPTKENIKQKREEYKRMLELENYAFDIVKDSDVGTQEYIKNITGNYSLWLTGPSLAKEQGSSFSQFTDGSTFLEIGKPKFGSSYGSDINFKTTNKKLRKSLRKYIVLHEYGHLYEFLKHYIEKGEIQEIPDTFTTDPKIRLDNEGKANAYAIDNSYRKDRRELLKNSDLTKEKYNKYKNENDILNKEHYMSDEYLAGAVKHSKTLKKTLDSIEKEKSHFNY